MAYCRCDDESDLYMYRCNLGYMFHFSHKTKFDNPNAQYDFFVEDAKTALKRMKEIKASGVKIPQRAIDRLSEEIKGAK